LKTYIKIKGAEPGSHHLSIDIRRNYIIDLFYTLIEELNQKHVYYPSFGTSKWTSESWKQC